MYYNKNQFLKIIFNKELPENSLTQIISRSHFSSNENYEILLALLECKYYGLGQILLRELKDYISKNPNLFFKLRKLISNYSEFDAILIDIEGSLIYSSDNIINEDINKFINHYDLNLKLCYEIAKKSNNLDYISKLKFLAGFNIGDINSLEKYFNSYLQIHHHDINIEKDLIFQRIKKEGFDLEQNDIYQIPKPEYSPYTVLFDGTLEILNKKEMFIYKFKEELVDLNNIYDSPYFLFIQNSQNDYFIGKRYYKEAIISYTSNFARTIRYANDSRYHYVDLIIKNGQYSKIFLRKTGSTNQIELDGDNSHYLENKIQKSSGIADISNLLTDYQDLIFRSPITGLVLVEGVAGSGKTNLIFHRIDYLLQEYPDKFKKDNIGIIVKNKYLKEYMLSSLINTDFSFKQEVTIEIYMNILIKLIERNSDLNLTHSKFKPIGKEIQIFHNKIKNQLRKFINNLLIQNINNLKINLMNEINNGQKKLITPQINGGIRIQGLDNLYLQVFTDFKSLINGFHISQEVSLSENLKNLKMIIKENLKIIKKKGIISEKNIDILEDNLDQIIILFQKNLVINYYQNNQLLFQNLLNKFSESNLIQNSIVLIFLLIDQFYVEIFGKNIIPIFDYLLIDEFQDFNYEDLYLLNYYYKSMIWSGDLTQSVLYNNKSFLADFQIIDQKLIQDNFRNTLEIVQFANQILQKCNIYNLNVKRVNKQGNKPTVFTYLEPNDEISQMQQLINNSLTANQKIGIAYMNINKIQIIIKQLQLNEQDYYADCISQKKFNTNYKIYFFDYNNIKGLEFDNMILLDVEMFVKNSAQGILMRLFYIGITRAINNLYLFMPGNCLIYLEQIVDKKFFSLIK